MNEDQGNKASESGNKAENAIEPEIVDLGDPNQGPGGQGSGGGEVPRGAVTEPARVMRIGAMTRQLLEEVRITELDDRGRVRLREIYDTSVENLASALSPDLQDELRSMAVPFGDDEVPSDSELRIAQAQLVGWLEGLFHGIQTTIFAQQAAAKQQLEQMQAAKPLPSGRPNPPQSGTYL